MNVIKKLSKEIFLNYLMYYRQGKLINMCNSVIVNPKVVAFSHEDDNILTVEKGDIKYVNLAAINNIQTEVQAYITSCEEFANADMTPAKHVLYSCFFIYLCLSDQYFLSDYMHTFNKKEEE